MLDVYSYKVVLGTLHTTLVFCFPFVVSYICNFGHGVADIVLVTEGATRQSCNDGGHVSG